MGIRLNKHKFLVKQTDIEIWGYAISIFLISMPYFVWHTPFSIGPILLLFCIIFSIHHVKVWSRTVKPIIIIILLYLIISIRGEYNFFGMISVLLICPLFLLDKKYLSEVFNAYAIIFSVTIIPSIIIYIMVMYIGIDLPSNNIEPLNKLKENTIYINYPFLVIIQDFGYNLPKFCGLYDEPGVVGTIAGILLIIRKFNLKDKFNIPIFIAGFISVSFFFYIILIIYIIAFLKTKYKILAIAFCAVFVAAFYSNEILYFLIFKRFTIEDGRISGDNRSLESYDLWFESFRYTYQYFWGLGGAASSVYNPGGASYKDIITNYGLIFFVLYLGCYLQIAFKRIKLSNNLITYIVIVFGIIYQRPFIENMFYAFLLYASLYALSSQQTLSINE